MQFLISRTSNWRNALSPYDGATRGENGKWYVEIDSLKDLVELFEEVGQLVIRDDINDEGIEIEIYDDWRE